MLDVLKESRDWHAVLQLCASMRNRGTRQDLVTYSSLVDSCQSKDSWEWMARILSTLLAVSFDQTCPLASCSRVLGPRLAGLWITRGLSSHFCDTSWESPPLCGGFFG